MFLLTLQLDKVLTSQVMQSGIKSHAVHDEHLFIITHQGKGRLASFFTRPINKTVHK